MPELQLARLALGPDAGETLVIVGDRARILADAAATGGQCTIFETITSPGVGPPLHRHANEDEYFYVTEGTVKFSIDGRVFVGTPGSFALAPRGSAHTFVNAGKSPCRMIISVTPSGLEVPFRANAEFLRRKPNATPAEIAAIFTPHGVEFVGPPLDPTL